MRVGKPLRGYFGSVLSLAFSPDSTLIASGSADETIRVWDATTGAAIGEPLRGHTHAVSSLAFLPDGSQLVSGSWDNTIRLWNTTSGAAFGEPLRHSSWVSVSFSGDGKHVASCSSYRTIRVWDTNLGVAKGILEPMGCDVVQTETETTVTGPPIGQLRALGDLDMMGAFLTASVLAAVATQPVSKERVNSTDGTRDQLRRFMALPINE